MKFKKEFKRLYILIVVVLVIDAIFLNNITGNLLVFAITALVVAGTVIAITHYKSKK